MQELNQIDKNKEKPEEGLPQARINLQEQEDDKLLNHQKSQSEESDGTKNPSSITELQHHPKQNKKKPPSEISKILFTHKTPIFELSAKRHLVLSDIPNLPPGMQADNLFKKFENQRIIENEKRLKALKGKITEEEFQRKIKIDYDIVKTLLKLTRKNFIIACLATLVHDCSIYLIPFFTKNLISEFKSVEKVNLVISIYMLSLLLLTPIIGIVKQNGASYTKKTKAASAQILRSIFYHKLKKSDYIFLEKSTPGFISQILNTEIDRICDFIGIIPKIISTPFSVILCSYFMFRSIGYLVWLPITLFLSLSLIKILIKSSSSEYVIKYSNLNAKRADIIEFLVENMGNVKINSREELYMKILAKLREEELKTLKKIHLHDSLINFINIMYPIASAAVSIGFYNKVSGQVLNSVSTYNLVSVTAVSKGAFGTVTKIYESIGNYIPAIQNFEIFLEKINETSDFDILKDEMKEEESTSDLKVSLKNCGFFFDFKSAKRVLKIIGQKKKNKNFSIKNDSHAEVADFLSKIDFDSIIHGDSDSEDSDDEENENLISGRVNLKQGLFDINLEARSGEKICIISSKDSAERTLLYSIMNETAMGKGELVVKGKMGILDLQNQSIFNTTLRENIILGKKFEKEKYDEILEKVSLDITKFHGKDFIEIMDRGANLSLLEIKKIQVARMLYSDTNILLYNEFLEDLEVDSEKEILFNALEERYNDGIIIYATDNMDFVKKSTRIYFLEKGKIFDEGSFEEMKNNPKSFMNELVNQGYFHQSETSSLKKSQRKKKEKEKKKKNKRLDLMEMNKKYTRATMIIEAEEKENEEKNDKILGAGLNSLVKISEGKIKRKSPKSSKSPKKNFWFGFKKIFFETNILLFLLIVLLLVISSLLLLLVEIWLGWWSISFFSDLENQDYFSYYLIINGSLAIVYFMTQILFKYLSRVGMMNVFKKIINELIIRDLTFFSENTSDDIIYKLTKDIMVLDTGLVTAVEKNISSIFLIIGGVVILSYVTYGIFALFFLLVIYKFTHIVKINLSSCQSFFDISLRMKSKLQHVLNSTLDDLINLRNLNSGNFFDKKFFKFSNDFQNSASHLGNVATAWLGVKTASYNSFLLLVVYLFILIFMIANPNYLLDNLYIISFSLNWVIKLRTYFENGIPNIIQAQTNMYSFHHVNEFNIFENRKKNEDKNKLVKLVVKPEEKVYELRNVNFSFGGRIKIFEGLNFTIKTGEKVCLMGKSGSGRHTFAELLMKSYEKTNYSTQEIFKIYGQDLKKIDPISLRKCLNYLSNDPILFFGKVRDNIDTEKQFSDGEIITTLTSLNFLSVLDNVGDEDDFEKDLELLHQNSSIAVESGQGGQSGQKETMEKGEPEFERTDMKAGDDAERFRDKENIDIEDFLNALAKHVEKYQKGGIEAVDDEEGMENLCNVTEDEKKRILDFLNQDYLTVKNKSIIKLLLAAKTILQKLPLLFVEEGSLNFDNSSEGRTYAEMKKNLKGTTVIGILSKFIHIFKYDKIAVLKEGKICEFDSPFELLKNQKSELVCMMRERSPGLLEKMLKCQGFMNLVKKAEAMKNEKEKSLEAIDLGKVH